MRIQYRLPGFLINTLIFAGGEAKLCRVRSSTPLGDLSTAIGSTSAYYAASASSTVTIGLGHANSASDTSPSKSNAGIISTLATTSTSSADGLPSVSAGTLVLSTNISFTRIATTDISPNESSVTSTPDAPSASPDTIITSIPPGPDLSSSTGTQPTTDTSFINAPTEPASTGETSAAPTEAVNPILTRFYLRAVNSDSNIPLGVTLKTQSNGGLYCTPPVGIDEDEEWIERQFYLEEDTNYLKVADIDLYVTTLQGHYQLRTSFSFGGGTYGVQCQSPIRRGDKLQCRGTQIGVTVFARQSTPVFLLLGFGPSADQQQIDLIAY